MPGQIEGLRVRSSSGELVRLEDVTTLDIGTGPTVITHMNRQRAATLFANTEADKPMAAAMNDLNAIAAKNLTDE
jgi:HAE1 family hydrophobic/amphiphilic exporter-1